ncbi:TonB-dependent receptor [Halomonas huangheensis]|uniref:TonB-denpendent receptor n=1 Tax=Halomonas huangheensis TaxID=1178482 RepID=W1N169_9GAMM|nr:TonB-dependent receptor [Halomonas huangheensis]ALM52369.1 TonB-dependent receptor [Halomonas huangheensis]ERL49307.1 hypothetical protein BJB45_07490 [Halomonas huangheensis]
MRGRQYIGVGTLASLLAVPVAEAQVLPAVTVTANKIEQKEERVPASLSVLYGEDLRDAGVDDLNGLARRTPNFTFQPFGQSGTNLPVVRGLSSSATAFSSSMLMLVDGVPTLMGQGFENSLVGVERVEILRGPQSTLYGRNAEAGVLSIHTLQPSDEPHARVDLGVGSRDKRSVRFDASGALLTDRLYAGIAGEWLAQDGFIDNRFQGGKEDDRERYNGRAVLRWEPTTSSSATLRYSRQEHDDGGSLWGPVDSSQREVRSGTDSWNRSQGSTLALDADLELSPGLRLRSISARNDFHDHVRQDTDFLPADITHLERDFRFNTISQELRLEGSSEEHQWLLGVYADRADHDLGFHQHAPLGEQRTETSLGGDTQAIFGQWIQPLSDRWLLTLGGRYEHDEVSLSPEGSDSRDRDWQRFTPKVALQYEWSDETQLYASYTQGFRAGGFNAFAGAADYPSYDPERVTAYEIGVKGWAFDRRLQYETAVYWMDISDMQVQQIVQPGVVFITNAAEAYSAGLELSVDYLLDAGWWLQASLGLNRTRFEEFHDSGGDYQGNRNPFAPEMTSYLGVRYDAQQGWFAQAGLTGIGSTFLDAANDYRQDGYALLDVSTGYQRGPYAVTFYVDNATDEDHDAIGFLNGTARVYSEPREVGLTVSYEL